MGSSSTGHESPLSPSPLSSLSPSVPSGCDRHRTIGSGSSSTSSRPFGGVPLPGDPPSFPPAPRTQGHVAATPFLRTASLPLLGPTVAPTYLVHPLRAPTGGSALLVGTPVLFGAPPASFFLLFLPCRRNQSTYHRSWRGAGRTHRAWSSSFRPQTQCSRPQQASSLRQA